jgi:hypothetical protein
MGGDRGPDNASKVGKRLKCQFQQIKQKRSRKNDFLTTLKRKKKSKK